MRDQARRLPRHRAQGALPHSVA